MTGQRPSYKSDVELQGAWWEWHCLGPVVDQSEGTGGEEQMEWAMTNKQSIKDYCQLCEECKSGFQVGEELGVNQDICSSSLGVGVLPMGVLVRSFVA